MNRTFFEVQQHTGHQYEPIQEGDFDTLQEAQNAMNELASELGWTHMRIMERVETDKGYADVVVALVQD